MPEPSAKDLKKWRALEAAQAVDYRDPLMQFLGHHLALMCNAEPAKIAELAMAMARDCVAYESDIARVGSEDFDSPAQVWRRGIDDCDGKARLFVALCKAADLQAKLVPHWKPDSLEPGKMWLSHVSAEVNLAGQWRPVELTLKRARLGEVAADVPKEADGKWLR